MLSLRYVEYPGRFSPFDQCDILVQTVLPPASLPRKVGWIGLRAKFQIQYLRLKLWLVPGWRIKQGMVATS